MHVELPTSSEGLVVLRNRATGEYVELEPAHGGAVRQIALLDHSSSPPTLLPLLQNGPGLRLTFGGQRQPSHTRMHQIPWPNRVRDGKYKLADGRSYEGLPINEPFPRHTSLHGLLYDRPMTTASYEDAAGDSTASVTFVHHLDGSDAGYPFKVKVELTYRLISAPGKQTRMECVQRGHGGGSVSTGWHPYIRLPAKSIDTLRMTMEAGETYIVDEQMIPVGSESWPGMDDDLLAGKKFDSGFRFAELSQESGGIHRTLLCDREARVTLVLWQDRSFPCFQIYTPDTRDSIALEPMSHATNGFNTNDYSLLQPGASTPGFKGTYGVYLQ
ncbi:aldose 1epimerase subfamily protein [Acanthamoeba castellanii str. Neff]|uniref:Aldose 1epimerase subfamily protein n=1 Tax=Acanthamoeba castellanii (strain ATCC 30010 / Neff) TaxID=1257118 RepID=L8HLA6_ACACF|nr:aldose 1epimerase subfamily protein [Acanthamoeba castellanii str. Neff]ELR25151.1 aldose 1epimerase subfamily protein [Acanthamoeba castellanii str. Neff]